jgi:hypothetical protein
VIVNSSPASARRSTSLTLFRSSFCGITGTTIRTVAELLPARSAGHQACPANSGVTVLLFLTGHVTRVLSERLVRSEGPRIFV